jgi:hypothetical protein
MKTRKLPIPDSIHELAKFWDTHDLTDYQAELEAVAGPVFVRGTPIIVHLQSKEAAPVQEIARSKGVSEGELIRTWVLQKLARPKGRGANGNLRRSPKSSRCSH